MQLSLSTIHKTPVHFIQTDKFKRLHLSIRFFALLDEKTVTARYLMLAMMRAKNKNFPTRKALARHLEGLYDANYGAQATKLGRYHILQYAITFINPAMIESATYQKQILDFFASIIHDVAFDAQILAEEKQFLKDYFAAEYSNKTRYAAKRYYDHLYQDHPYNIHPFGIEKQIDTITLADIEKAYHAMMTNDKIVLSLSGDFDEKSFQMDLEKRFNFSASKLPKDFFIQHAFTKRPPIKETLDVSQERLFMTLNTGITYGDPSYFSLVVMNAMFGESPESLLFETIREKHAMAYYVHSAYAPFSGLITVSSGVKKANVEKAQSLIKTTLAAIAEGNFSDEAFSMAKNSLIIQLKQSYDSLKSLPNKGLQHVLFNLPLKKEILLEKLNRVRKEDVIGVAGGCQWVFSYVLGGNDDEKTSLSQAE